MSAEESVLHLDFNSVPTRSNQTAPGASWRDMGDTEHFVQFYENDIFLTQSVSAFMAAGFGNGDSAIVIATRQHREAIEEILLKEGHDLDGLESRGEYIALDAAETLAKFMIGGSPNQRLFNKVMGGLVNRAVSSGRKLRAFGEMVALLWADGNQEAAIQLEEFWNALMKNARFSLFCAYPMDGFRGEANGKPLIHVCKAHARVIPAESYAAKTSAEERLQTITLLQQKASSLEAEIEERRHAESGILAEQTKLNMAAAVAELGIWEMDLTTNAVTCSDQCKAHFGLAPDETPTYQRGLELIHADDREGVITALREAIAANGNYKCEYRVIDGAGKLRWIASMGRCFHNGEHRMLGVTQDITERKLSAEILEQTIAERTTKLQETIAELEGFSYSISHDMRSPLRAMQGYAKALVQDYGGKLDGSATEYLERIQRAASRLDLLIRDVLAYSKVANGHIELKAVALEPLVKDILEHPEFEAMKSSVTVESPLGIVMGHEAYLTQCITNLVANALKFVKPGETPRVRIQSENFGDKVRVSVSDTGIGIHPDHQDRIFKIFGRVHSNKQYEGTGIGLAIVKKAVARMGGEIGFESVSDRGTTFSFVLPNAAQR